MLKNTVVKERPPVQQKSSYHTQAESYRQGLYHDGWTRRGMVQSAISITPRSEAEELARIFAQRISDFRRLAKSAALDVALLRAIRNEFKLRFDMAFIALTEIAETKKIAEAKATRVIIERAIDRYLESKSAAAGAAVTKDLELYRIIVAATKIE